MKSRNDELFEFWISQGMNTNKMYGLSKKDRKIISLAKKLGIIYFITFFIFFLSLAESVLSK
ncbi:hypothetical protein [Thalassobellus citreus]|uniref:hypothetical protein n=1 Tax=Thalassobellus citreus TaxID=3367752 RepID=UPI0037A94419